jgi:hypothetical protein
MKVIPITYICLLLVYTFIPFGSAVHHQLLRSENVPSYQEVSKIIKNLVGSSIYFETNIEKIKPLLLERISNLNNPQFKAIKDGITSLIQDHLQFDFDHDFLQSVISLSSHSLRRLDTDSNYALNNDSSSSTGSAYLIIVATIYSIILLFIITGHVHINKNDQFQNLSTKDRMISHVLFLIATWGFGALLAKLTFT